MVSPSKAGFNLRENTPLPVSCIGQRTDPTHKRSNGSPRLGSVASQPKGRGRLTDVPCRRSGYREEREGLCRNRHLIHLAESILGNVGDSRWDAKASSPPMPIVSVGAAIVLRGWESQPHGEGPQSVGTSNAEVAE